MDADNRVVLNCGGIRHEVYKVDNEKLMISIYVCALEADHLVPNIKSFPQSEKNIYLYPEFLRPNRKVSIFSKKNTLITPQKMVVWFVKMN